MLNAAVRAARRVVREDADLAGDLAGREVPDQAHLAGEAERASIAQPTCVEMQNVCAGVSGMNTDSIAGRRPGAAGLRASRPRTSWRDDRGVSSVKASASRARRAAAEVGHRGEIGDAAR